jgi:hypothetical protein
MTAVELTHDEHQLVRSTTVQANPRSRHTIS